ncbi:hypothetical protein HYV91_03585 [Candidatus Wolfebacteria bacterium]|nr:hypothetical protein [Candidatus Wolfebacteria bacterium]
MFTKQERGVVALPAIILISLLVLVAGLGISSSGFLEGSMSFNDAEGKKALLIAEAGAEDAFMRVARNKLCNEGGLPDCSAYALSLLGGVASVAVSGSNPKTITSEGAIGAKKRTVQIEISFDSVNQASQTSWKEI